MRDAEEAVARRRDQLVSAKGTLLEKSLQEATAPRTVQPGLPRRPTQGDYPLSYSQEGLWFFDQWQPGDPVNNRAVALRLSGPLEIRALERSVSEVVRRHEVLRAAFRAVDGQPVQVVAKPQPITLSLVDISELAPADREVEARRLVLKESQHPFNLAQDPLLRASLLCLGPADHALVLVIHHIAFDARSEVVLRRELALLYEAFSTGRPSPLPDLPIQFSDFAYWQRQSQEDDFLQEQLAYWQNRLADLPSSLDLPTDRSRPAIQTYRGAQQLLSLSPSLVKALKALSQREDLTLFMTLLAAFQVLLYRYTGQEDIVVGSFATGRSHVETEPLIGYFANILAMRTDLSGEPSLATLLGRVRAVVPEAFDHQDLPFERLVQELSLERDLSRPPVFQVMFNLENSPVDHPQPAGLSMEEFHFDPGTAPVDLYLQVLETGEHLSCLASYNTDLFDAGTIRRVLGHYRTLLEGIVADPEQTLSHLPLLTKAQEHELVVEWNSTKRSYGPDVSIPQLFEIQVKRTPAATAFFYDDQELSYAELNQRANQVAHFLQSLGVGPKVIVGLCIERSLDMMVGLLGILKAGGTYLPLDPTYPEERLAFMLQDAQAEVLLTTVRLTGILPEVGARIVRLDADAGAIAQCSGEDLASVTVGSGALFVIYTSGSTGRPKGVVGLHQGTVNRLSWMWDVYPFARNEVCCQRTALSFVDSVWEIFGPLLQGIPTAIIPYEVVRDPDRLIKSLAHHSVSRMVLVPSLLRALLDADAKLGQRLPNLKYWISEAEPLTWELVQRFRVAASQSVLLNIYGSTEVYDATCYDTSQMRGERTSVPIGRPIANTQIYILDRHKVPVPIGVWGELYAGGDGLARGYLNRPQLTEERFIRNPFNDEPGALLFRTGDLGRYRPDGNIEYLSRIDHQVKIRGFRIELGEIEIALSQHPGVRDAVVTAREDLPGDQRLVAYVVPREEAAPTTSSLRGFLGKVLPDYMVPSAYVMLDALPLTPSRKVDRRSLPAPDLSRQDPDQALVAPRTWVEEELAGIWIQVLGLERAGVHEDFFALGGHSLLAMKVFSRVREVFQVELHLRSLFETPTIAGLAESIEIARWAAQPRPPHPKTDIGGREEGEL